MEGKGSSDIVLILLFVIRTSFLAQSDPMDISILGMSRFDKPNLTSWETLL
jgi:hypothetical protein